jgi:hypothetical protein
MHYCVRRRGGDSTDGAREDGHKRYIKCMSSDTTIRWEI